MKVLSTEKEAILATNTTLQCASAGFPTPSITWLKDGIPITQGMGITQLTTPASTPSAYNNPTEGRFGVVSTLRFDSVQKSDIGNYNCSARNSLPQTGTLTAVSGVVQLIVLGKL